MRGTMSLFGIGLALGAGGMWWSIKELGGGTVLLSKPDAGGAPTAQAFFSPQGGCTAAAVEAIGTAQREVLVQAYSFTSSPIRDALIAAHRRGVRVGVIMDRQASEESYSERHALAKAGIAVWTDGDHPIAHNKIIIVDRATIVTGSFNFTKQAETGNAENLLVLRHAELAERYVQNWEAHRAHSERVKK
jgi:phosphatidylserine/phosphatidylglycerophosphate/cardiolipin synthase-like enzyme